MTAGRQRTLILAERQPRAAVASGLKSASGPANAAETGGTQRPIMSVMFTLVLAFHG